MKKWVCITKNIRYLTYGKIYDAEEYNVPAAPSGKTYNLLVILNDIGIYNEFPLFVVRRYGPLIKKNYNFMPLEEWRNKKIEDILIRETKKEFDAGVVWVDVQCANCDDFYTTYQMIHDGSIQQYCCSQDCCNEYHSVRKKRERRLNILLNE